MIEESVVIVLPAAVRRNGQRCEFVEGMPNQFEAKTLHIGGGRRASYGPILESIDTPELTDACGTLS
ncbi:hypothetical protein RGCCGE502_18560 [Rhizobium grahamii CCGE 502]|uniref:Uncharacterized protein n=1 Tax=Rhizobium grahamii CCGE 502 TaxID=990285 RepID=S3HDA1_9HYPH|nr:hypothetical protein RGCCGE502_18560 [Rhizobium grahamii CCGE 502]